MNDHNSEKKKYEWPKPGMGAAVILAMTYPVMLDGKLFNEKGIVSFLNESYQVLNVNKS